MRILLDENFPLPLVWKLQDEGHEVEHIILLGSRGTPDGAIIERLRGVWSGGASREARAAFSTGRDACATGMGMGSERRNHRKGAC
jgi:hypothetical protein